MAKVTYTGASGSSCPPASVACSRNQNLLPEACLGMKLLAKESGRQQGSVAILVLRLLLSSLEILEECLPCDLCFIQACQETARVTCQLWWGYGCRAVAVAALLGPAKRKSRKMGSEAAPFPSLAPETQARQP